MSELEENGENREERYGQGEEEENEEGPRPVEAQGQGGQEFVGE